MSATQARVGLIVGATLVGAFFGAPGLGFALGTVAGGLLFPGPDPPAALGPQLGDLQVQVSAYGNAVPWIFGTERIAGNVTWNSTIREIAHAETQSGGGKGGAPKQESITFTYEVDLYIELCKGPIDGLGRMWADDKLFYDFSNPPHARGVNTRLYFGTTTQKPDPTIEADKGVGNVSANRGKAGILFRSLDLTPFGNRVPTFHFEVHANGNPNLPVSLVEDVPQGGGLGRIAIDPDTGLIWSTRTGNDKIYVWRCNNGLEKVCEIDVLLPDFISYQPQFLGVNVDFLGTVTQQLIPPKMWVGQSFPDGIDEVGIKSYATDGSCRLYDDFINPYNDSFFCWPGAVLVDLQSIDRTGPNMDGPTLLSALTNGACSWAGAFSLNPLASGLVPVNFSVNNVWLAAGIEHVADWISAGDVTAGVDWDGRVFILASGINASHVVLGAASFANRNNSITYDPEEERIYTKIFVFSAGPVKIAKWDKSLNKIWEFDADVAGDDFLDPVRIRYHQGVGDVWIVGRKSGDATNTWARRIDKEAGKYQDEEFSFAFSGFLDDFQPFAGAPFAIGTKFSFPGGVVKFPLGPGAVADPPTLAFVVQSIVEESEILTAADIDVTSLVPFVVRGFALAQRQPVRNALQPLMLAYFFDAVESDDKIKFVRRGNNPVVVIPPEHMNARRDHETNPGNVVQERRTQEIELPNSLDIRYISLDTEYKIGVVSSRRLIGDSQQQRTQDVPIVLTSTEAKLINDVLIHNIWFERNNKTLQLAKRYMHIEPTDVVTITTPDQGTIDVRLSSVGLSIPNLLEWEVKEEDISIYTDFVSPGAFGLQPQPEFPAPVPVVLIVLDTSTLRDLDNNTGLYVVAYSIGATFTNASVLQSRDGIIYGPGAGISTEGNVGFSESRLTWGGSFS
jgi:hypothetical protein